MMKNSLLILFLAIMLSFSCTKEKNKEYQLEIFQVTNGYGYIIKYNEKLLVKQEYIPSLNGKYSFTRYEDAQIVGNFVKDKLIDNKSPTVNKTDLQKMGVTLPWE